MPRGRRSCTRGPAADRAPAGPDVTPQKEPPLLGLGIAAWLILIVGPWYLLIVLLQPSPHVLGWAAASAWIAFPLAVLFHGFSSGRNLMLADRIAPLGYASGLVLACMLLLSPAEAIFLAPEAWYPAFQVLAVLLLVVCGARLGLLVDERLVAVRRPATLAQAILDNARTVGPSTRAGRRRRQSLRAAKQVLARAPVAERVRASVTHRTALMWRYLALTAVVLVAGVPQLVLASGAFAEGWVALLVGLALLLETRLHVWRRETLADGFADPDPWAGRTLYDAWWGLSAGLVLVLTLRTTAAMGGVRSDLWLWYVLVLAAAIAASVLPFRVARSHSRALFDRWLARNPRRAEELRALVTA